MNTLRASPRSKLGAAVSAIAKDMDKIGEEKRRVIELRAMNEIVPRSKIPAMPFPKSRSAAMAKS